MPRLPVLSGREAAAMLHRAGWTAVRHQGSHLIFEKEGREETLSVPLHAELRRGTLRTLIRRSGMSVDEFLAFR